MSWLHYLLEANIYLSVFYLCYRLLLNRDTHYNLSRAFLLFGCVVSFILPFTQASILRPQQIPVGEIIIEPVPMQTTAPVITLADITTIGYALGLLVAIAILLQRLYRLMVLTRSNQVSQNVDCTVVSLEGDNTAFSFFNYLFIGSGVAQPETIIAHELVHIRQRHSIDILFVEVLKAINWFNPFIYLIQRSLKTLHEYIADEQTVAHGHDALAYSSFLLHNAYGLQGEAVANSFFNHNLLKRRIIMLNKKRSGGLARLKYLAVLPLCGGMLCASTLVFSKDYAVVDLAKGKPAAIKLTPAREVSITLAQDTIPPPPPPAPPTKVRKANGAPKSVPPLEVVEVQKTPPPPPPLPRKKSKSKIIEVAPPPPPPGNPAEVKEIEIEPPVVEKPGKLSKVKIEKLKLQKIKPEKVKLEKVKLEKLKTSISVKPAAEVKITSVANVKVKPIVKVALERIDIKVDTSARNN